MRILIDAHALLWATGLSPRLSDSVRGAISDVDNDVLVSVATLWEIAIKVNIGKLSVHSEFFEDLESKGFEILSLSLKHIQDFQSLPLHHRDPFDRILVAQARCDGLVIATRDPLFDAYDVDTIW